MYRFGPYIKVKNVLRDSGDLLVVLFYGSSWFIIVLRKEIIYILYLIRSACLFSSSETVFNLENITGIKLFLLSIRNIVLPETCRFFWSFYNNQRALKKKKGIIFISKFTTLQACLGAPYKIHETLLRPQKLPPYYINSCAYNKNTITNHRKTFKYPFRFALYSYVRNFFRIGCAIKCYRDCFKLSRLFCSTDFIFSFDVHVFNIF